MSELESKPILILCSKLRTSNQLKKNRNYCWDEVFPHFFLGDLFSSATFQYIRSFLPYVPHFSMSTMSHNTNSLPKVNDCCFLLCLFFSCCFFFSLFVFYFCFPLKDEKSCLSLLEVQGLRYPFFFHEFFFLYLQVFHAKITKTNTKIIECFQEVLQSKPFMPEAPPICY